MDGKPDYVIVARKPKCGCIVMISAYYLDREEYRRDLAAEVFECVADGLLIQTVPFDEHPLKTEKFGCDHVDRQLQLSITGE